MGYFSFPHTRTYDSDLGWLIKHLKGIDEKLDEYLENSVITFADPIQWNITEQYTALTMVIDSDGTAYLSKQPVLAGIDISNTDYWMPIFNYNDNINQLRDQIAYNAQESATTDVNLDVNDLVFWHGLIYRVITPMTAGSAFIIDSNIEKYTVDEKFGLYADDLTTEIADRIAADNGLGGRIDDEIADRIAADNGLGGRIDDEIADRIAADNTLSDRIDAIDFTGVYIVPEDYGARGDGTTDDTAALQRCFDLKKPVYLRNDYLISAPLTYSGTELYGTGQIIVDSLESDQNRALEIQGESIRITGLRVNANDAACIGIWINVNRDVIIEGVTVANTSTTYYASNYGSGGIYIAGCSKAEISQCYVHDVNRDKGVPLTHSSFGIVANVRNEAYIHDNLIERIRCSLIYYDCDGIYVTYIDDTDKTMAVIENNKIFDCTGRFIKSQCTYTVVRNNYCKLNVTFTPNAGYFHCVSIQRGSFEIVNNYFYLGTSIHRSYTRCFAMEITDETPKTGIISGNVIEANKTGAFPDQIRNYFSITSVDAPNNVVNIDISNNVFTGRAEAAIGLSAAYAINGIIKFTHNKTNMYQVIECPDSYTNFDKIYLEAMYIENKLYTGSSRLSTETAVFTKLKYRFNSYLNESINNYPINYNDLEFFEGYYRGNIQQMTNVPAEIARGDYLFMIKSPAITEYHCFANNRSGYIFQ